MRSKLRYLTAGLILPVMIFLNGCATVNLMPDEFDIAAKEFSPQAGISNLYITRTSSFGGAILFSVHVDGRLIGQIAYNTYYLVELEPGKHQVAILTTENQDVLNVDTLANTNYFIEVIPKMGWVAARAEIKILSEDEGRTKVNKSKRALSLAFQ